MTRFDEVTRLRELEENAEPAPWTIKTPEHNDGYQETWIVGPGETGVMPIFDDEDDHLNVAMRNAAPWLLEALACFQPGDARKIDAFFRDCMCPDSELPNDCSMCDDDTIDFCNMFRRFQTAAEIMEGQE